LSAASITKVSSWGFFLLGSSNNSTILFLFLSINVSTEMSFVIPVRSKASLLNKSSWLAATQSMTKFITCTILTLIKLLSSISLTWIFNKPNSEVRVLNKGLSLAASLKWPIFSVIIMTLVLWPTPDFNALFNKCLAWVLAKCPNYHNFGHI